MRGNVLESVMISQALRPWILLKAEGRHCDCNSRRKRADRDQGRCMDRLRAMDQLRCERASRLRGTAETSGGGGWAVVNGITSMMTYDKYG